MGLNNNGVIPELSPETDDSISQMCQQLTQGITAMSDDPFASAPMTGTTHPTGPIKQHSMPATFHTSTGTGKFQLPFNFSLIVRKIEALLAEIPNASHP